MSKGQNGYANGVVVEDEEREPAGGHTIIKSTTISKEDLVLMPNGKGSSASLELPKNDSFSNLQQESILSDCLDYIHAGVEAIIEDEVTQRFVAEELKVRDVYTQFARIF